MRDETTKGCVGEWMLTCLLSSSLLYQPSKLVLPYTNEFSRGHSALNGPVIANSLLANQNENRSLNFKCWWPR